MGAGSTIAAALALGYDSIGIEIDPVFFKIAERAIPRLARIDAGNGIPASGLRRRVRPSDDVLALPFQPCT
jgi:hypothetical protein